MINQPGLTPSSARPVCGLAPRDLVGYELYGPPRVIPLLLEAAARSDRPARRLACSGLTQGRSARAPMNATGFDNNHPGRGVWESIDWRANQIVQLEPGRAERRWSRREATQVLPPRSVGMPGWPSLAPRMAPPKGSGGRRDLRVMFRSIRPPCRSAFRIFWALPARGGRHTPARPGRPGLARRSFRRRSVSRPAAEGSDSPASGRR